MGCGPRTSKRPSRLQLIRARRDKMHAAECREEVVQRHFVGQVDDAEPQTESVPVRVQHVVYTNAEIEHVPRRNARGIVQWVAGAGRWHNESACCDAFWCTARKTGGCRRRHTCA